LPEADPRALQRGVELGGLLERLLRAEKGFSIVRVAVIGGALHEPAAEVERPRAI
jgi:hypothetical protein